MRTRAYRFSGSIPAFPAQWFHGLSRALLGVPGLIATVARAALSCELDTSVGVSGPHVFAVRHPRVRLARASRPSHLTATYLAIAIRPLVWVRRADLNQ